MKIEMTELELEVDAIALKECPYADTVSKIFWVAGFRAGYMKEKPKEEITLSKKQRKESYKSVNVFKNGVCISRDTTLLQAAILSNMSYSRVYALMQTKQKSKSGYSFKH